MGDFRQKHLDEVKERFAGHISKYPDFAVKQLHRDNDVVKLWRCGRPGSSNCEFYVCSSIGCLMVYGDMGEYMWQRHRDMIPFIRGSIGSLNYFSEKVPSGIEIKTGHPELVDEWFEDVKADRIEYGDDWGDNEDEALEELKEFWEYNGNVDAFLWQYADSVLNTDCEDFPKVEFYTFHYLWIIEGLKWFIQQLDGGNVLPYQEPAVSGK